MLFRSSDVARATGDVLDIDLCPQSILQFGGQQPRANVHGTSRREGCDKPELPVRIIGLREGVARIHRSKRKQRGKRNPGVCANAADGRGHAVLFARFHGRSVPGGSAPDKRTEAA